MPRLAKSKRIDFLVFNISAVDMDIVCIGLHFRLYSGLIHQPCFLVGWLLFYELWFLGVVLVTVSRICLQLRETHNLDLSATEDLEPMCSTCQIRLCLSLQYFSILQRIGFSWGFVPALFGRKMSLFV